VFTIVNLSIFTFVTYYFTMDFDKIFTGNREQSLHGRYVTLNHIEPLIKSHSKNYEVEVLGSSVMNKPLYGITVGTGKSRIFIWSQMHGNESTTTKAIFDFLNLLGSDDDLAVQLTASFTFYILPMVNPDGAELYIRENANKVDLNRDALNLTQPESIVLRKAFDNFDPHFCYNMHDQRGIFGAGSTGKPATVSFLAPSYNDERSINNSRQTAINLISAMNDALQDYIPGQVGRFDDSFNINCVGDMFQSLGVPTVLFEAGHYQDDYIREITRKYIFIALLSGFNAIYENVIAVNKNHEYFAIPQNRITFYDFVYRNVKINYENKEKITNFASHYKEVLFENSVIFEACINKIGDLEEFQGHREYDCNGALFTSDDHNHLPIIDKRADFIIGFDRKFVNGAEET